MRAEFGDAGLAQLLSAPYLHSWKSLDIAQSGLQPLEIAEMADQTHGDPFAY